MGLKKSNKENLIMKKYQLFSEFNDKEIYGDSLSDAILHARLRRCDTWDRDNQCVIRGESIIIAAVVGTEDTTSSTRGDYKFERVVVELRGGERISIDARQIDNTHLAAATLGHKGGSVKSERKAKSSRENGKKGGRPRKEKK